MDTSRFSLEGKVALITGGSRGIGQAIALTFADAGADVVISARKLPELEIVAEKIRLLGRKSLAIASHVGKVEELKNLVEKAKSEFGRIDILVNNAGTNPYYGPVMDAEEWAWDVTMNVNLKGPFMLSQLVARTMKDSGSGRIINISSNAGIAPSAMSLYSLTKAGLIMLTKILAKEWGQYGIRVNAIAPGTVETRLSEVLWKDPAAAEAQAKRAALGRHGMPDEIAGVALLLASDASSYMTGDTIIVDGGESIGPPSFPDRQQ